MIKVLNSPDWQRTRMKDGTRIIIYRMKGYAMLIFIMAAVEIWHKVYPSYVSN